ncbi:MAG TPA: HAMP domain-containing sensor histidine kinase, partial [Coriobacteriia bacterium]|nr:HAMP domain-containing sensor histidine kinase [Coriobacteriia bacterium]
MHRLSLRGWLLIVSVLFAVLVVGGISLTTYVIVSDGMQVVAYDTTQRVADAAVVGLRGAVENVERGMRVEGLQGDQASEVGLRRLTEALPPLLGGAGLSEAEFALYSSEGPEVLWSSSDEAIHAAQLSRRAEAARTGVSTYSTIRRDDLFSGLINDAELGVTVVHEPVELPGGGNGVLDVTYLPSNEQKVIDAIRLPMAILAVSAMLIMVVLMQTSMAWVLNLVDDLRKAADSIDAGRLDERLPGESENEIGELAQSINRLIERLQRRSEAQGRFVADASHELATPVAGIRGYTSILRAWGGEDEKVREEAIDAIDRESRRMARLSSDLLNLLHADQGLVLKSERLDLNVLVRERLATTASR